MVVSVGPYRFTTRSPGLAAHTALISAVDGASPPRAITRSGVSANRARRPLARSNRR